MGNYLELHGGKIAYDDTGNCPLVIRSPSMRDLRAYNGILTP